MASTALITFRLRVPSEIQTVDVLGSWDNFQETYPLRQDREAGHWRGCHRFKNIICDGHRLDPSASRDGALKMGGTYWYYYQLNGQDELHDPIQPSTTQCPLLPGQRVNVLEVPIQLHADDSQNPSSCESSISAVFTLDPKAKYKSPRSSMRSATPDPLTLDHSRNQNHIRRQAGVPPQSAASDSSETSQGLCVSLPKASSWMAMFHKMRRLRSAPSTRIKGEGFRLAHPNGPWRGATSAGPPPRQNRQMPATQLLSNRVKAPPCTPDRTPTISRYASNGSPTLEPRTLDFRRPDLNASHSTSRVSSLDLEVLRISSARGVDSRSQETPKKAVEIASPPSGPAEMKPRLGSLYKNARENAASASRSTSPSRDESQAIRSAASPLILPIQSNAVTSDNSTDIANVSMRDSTPDLSRWPPSLLHHSEDTLTALYMDNAALGTPLSPHYLSQPETPSIRDFDETWALESVDSQNGTHDNVVGDSPAPSGADSLLQLTKLPGSCLSVYHLPEGDHISAPTLPKSDPKDLVKSWDDGYFEQDETRSDHPLTDLGYLGQAII